MRASVIDRDPKAPSHRRNPVRPGSLVAAFLAVACGGEAAPVSQTAAQETQEVSACDLLTAADILEVTGREPGDPVPQELGSNFFECRWMLAGGSEQLAYAAYRPVGAPRTYEAWVEEYRASMGEDFDESQLESYELISDVGGEFAVYADADFLGGLIQVYSDGRALIVGTMKIDGKSNRDLALALAAKAVGRLP